MEFFDSAKTSGGLIVVDRETQNIIRSTETIISKTTGLVSAIISCSLSGGGCFNHEMKIVMIDHALK
jgi:hypothetical protein